MQENSKLNKSFNLTDKGVIFNEDCYKVFKHLKDNSVDLIITDPPYEFTQHDGGGAFGSKKREYHNELEDSKIVDGFDYSLLNEFIRVMKKVNLYIWCNKEQLLTYLKFFENYNVDLLTWHKTNPVPTCNNKYLSDTEYLLFFREKGVKVYGSYKTKKKYYVTPTNKSDKEKYNHPTVKPLEIINNLVINSSQENDVILDPFMGSGTIGVAALQNNRKFIGMEIDESYYDIAKKRIEEMLDFQENYIEE